MRRAVQRKNPVDLAAFTQSHGDFEKALYELVAYGNEHKADSNPAVSENHSVADANFRTFVRRRAQTRCLSLWTLSSAKLRRRLASRTERLIVHASEHAAMGRRVDAQR